MREGILIDQPAVPALNIFKVIEKLVIYGVVTAAGITVAESDLFIMNVFHDQCEILLFRSL